MLSVGSGSQELYQSTDMFAAPTVGAPQGCFRQFDGAAHTTRVTWSAREKVWEREDTPERSLESESCEESSQDSDSDSSASGRWSPQWSVLNGVSSMECPQWSVLDCDSRGCGSKYWTLPVFAPKGALALSMVLVTRVESGHSNSPL